MAGHPLRTVLLILGLAATLVYSFWFAFKSWGKNRALVDTPTSRIRSAAQGYVELSGRGMLPADAQNRGPLTGLPCTWWRYSVEDRGNRGGPRISSSWSWGDPLSSLWSWSCVSSDTSTVPFLLDDGTGRCLVDPRGAEVFPSVTTVWYGTTEWPEGRIPGGGGALGWLIDRIPTGRYRYTEHRLELKEHVCALGAFRSEGGVSVDDPDAAVTDLLHQWKQDQAALLKRFDANRDGALSAAEWEQARAAARQEVLNSRAADTRTPSLNVLSEPMDGRCFLLAASEGGSLARRFRYRALAGIGGFVGSAAALTWMLTRVW
jgi:E3 ubiquitin ligase